MKNIPLIDIYEFIALCAIQTKQELQKNNEGITWPLGRGDVNITAQVSFFMDDNNELQLGCNWFIDRVYHDKTIQ